MPNEIITSGMVGQYSATSPNEVGMNPATTIPKPLSIHIDAKIARQIPNSIFSLLRALGKSKKTKEDRARIIETHIHGTKFVFPSRPKKRYWK